MYALPAPSCMDNQQTYGNRKWPRIDQRPHLAIIKAVHLHICMAGFASALALDANEIQVEKHIELVIVCQDTENLI